MCEDAVLYKGLESRHTAYLKLGVQECLGGGLLVSQVSHWQIKSQSGIGGPWSHPQKQTLAAFGRALRGDPVRIGGGVTPEAAKPQPAVPGSVPLSHALWRRPGRAGSGVAKARAFGWRAWV